MPQNFASPQQGFFQGMNESLNRDEAEERQRLQSRLDLQMLSKKIELEQQAKSAELQQKKAEQTLPPQEMAMLGSLYKGLQSSLQNGASPEFDLSKFSSPAGQAMAARLLDIYASHAMAGSKTESYQVPWYSDVTGQRIGYKSFNQFGKPLAQKADPGAADKEKQAVALLNGLASLDSLDSAEKNIDFGRLAGIGSSVEAKLGLDSGNMARFNAFKNLVASMATPLITGSHRFAPAEQAQLQTMLGTAFSTPQEVQAAANAIRRVYNTGAATLGIGEDPGWMQKHAARMAAMHVSQPLGYAADPSMPSPSAAGTLAPDAEAARFRDWQSRRGAK